VLSVVPVVAVQTVAADAPVAVPTAGQLQVRTLVRVPVLSFEVALQGPQVLHSDHPV
jgi:hypothetical protein